MGCVLSVWSPVEKTGKTVLTYLLAHKLTGHASNRPRILLCCANTKSGTLQNLFKSASTVGMEDLVNIGVASDGERLNLYGMLDKRSSMYFIGTSRSGPAFVSRYADAYRNLIHEFRGLFDLVLADVPSDSNNLLGKLFLEESDYIVNLLPQKPELLRGQPFKNKKDIAYIVNKCTNLLVQPNEFPGIYMTDNVFRLPYCSKLADFHKRKLFDIYTLQESEFNKAFSAIADELILTLGLSRGGRKPVAQKPRKTLAALLEGSA